MKEKNYLEKDLSEELIKISTMYESLRYNEYTMENGMGEIVDNAVEAGASIISVEIKRKVVKVLGKKKEKEIIDEIAIIDDGCGMDKVTLSKCLVLGESMHPRKNGKLGIGRFGVGMTLGSISLARRIEVYSRSSSSEQFMFTYIDLDEIQNEEQNRVPEPKEERPADEYFELLNGSSGTIVILKKCDRLVQSSTGKSTEASEVIKKMANYLGRTYRKFIATGVNIRLDGKKVYLHDPLFLLGPTVFDTKEHIEPKAVEIGQTKIELDIPGKEGEKAEVVVTMTLLPEEWRKKRGDGRSDFAKKRKIDQNEGISILRANREVLYAHVPYTTGKRGESKALDIDRFWGCEVSFPPELDDYFQVRYIKRGAEPIESLREQLLKVIGPTVKTLRKMIQETYAKNEFEDRKEAGDYQKAEATMQKMNSLLPSSKKGKEVSERKENDVINNIVEALDFNVTTEVEKEKKKEEKREKIKKQPYSIEMVKYPETILFEPVFLLDKIIIQLNINHPFYKHILRPLCGDVINQNETDEKVELNQKSQIKDAIMLLLLSYCKAESMFNNHEDLFQSLRIQWGTILSAVIKDYMESNK